MKVKISNGNQLSVVCNYPTTPTSGAPVLFGSMTGVAITDESADGNASGYTTVDFGGGVYDLSVTDVATGGIAVGAELWLHAGSPCTIDNVSASGYFFGYALEAIGSGLTDTINVRHVQSPGAGTLGTGTVGTTQLATAGVTAAKLSATLKKGFIPLDITTVRIIATNAIQNTTEGGVPDGNTAPSLARVNGATDKALRLAWAASSSEEVQFGPFVYPPDLDDASAVEIHLLAAMAGTTDTPVIAVGAFEGVGDTNAGGNTAAVTGTSVAEYSVSVAHGDVGAHPKALNITLTPAAHTTDALYIYGAWIEYTRA